MTAFKIFSTNRSNDPIVIGDGFPKIVAIVGITESHKQSISEELKKCEIANEFGASMVADVSTDGDISKFYNIFKNSVGIPLSTVPIYEIRKVGLEKGYWPNNISKEFILDIISEQIDRGVGCMTFHTSMNRSMAFEAIESNRKIKLQSRGGGLMYEYMKANSKENFFVEYLEDILKLLNANSITFSVGSSFRPGTIADLPDYFMLNELLLNCNILDYMKKQGINCMMEIGSHHRYNSIYPYVKYLKSQFYDVPLRLLGPIGTEKGLGYDHITGAISAVPAIQAGLDVITCVTRSEHIGRPDANDIRESLVAMRIAIELALQSDQPSQKNDINFSCGLGFESFKPEDLIDLERALELKREKNDGNLNGCNMCKESCRMVTKGISNE